MSETITIQGATYNEADLPDNAKQLVAVYKKWNNDLVEARFEVSKNEAALRELAKEIVEAVKDVKPVETAEAPAAE